MKPEDTQGKPNPLDRLLSIYKVYQLAPNDEFEKEIEALKGQILEALEFHKIWGGEKIDLPTYKELKEKVDKFDEGVEYHKAVYDSEKSLREENKQLKEDYELVIENNHGLAKENHNLLMKIKSKDETLQKVRELRDTQTRNLEEGIYDKVATEWWNMFVGKLNEILKEDEG